MRSRRLLVFATALAAACQPAADATRNEPPRRATRVDSAVDMRSALARFRTGLPRVDSLTYAARTRDELARRFVRALERSDTAALQRLVLSRAEFAWLYYPSNPQSRPPYELPADVMWFQTEMANRKGLVRALTRFGGRPLDFAGYACASEPETQGDNRVWTGCRLRVRAGQRGTSEIRLFGAVLERDSRFKIISYANDL